MKKLPFAVIYTCEITKNGNTQIEEFCTRDDLTEQEVKLKIISRYFHRKIKIQKITILSKKETHAIYI